MQINNNIIKKIIHKIIVGISYVNKYEIKLILSYKLFIQNICKSTEIHISL